MLQYTAARNGARFMVIVHYTDAEREWGYDRNLTSAGSIRRWMRRTRRAGRWDMKRDWRRVFPFEK